MNDPDDIRVKLVYAKVMGELGGGWDANRYPELPELISKYSKYVYDLSDGEVETEMVMMKMIEPDDPYQVFGA